MGTTFSCTLIGDQPANDPGYHYASAGEAE
jgi:hypothetical protein